ncbi:hypothetical protein NMG29_10165 [Streptomyces cocklensis]|uniref:Uncharacterized protein n=1 Tax=Actinacidiphila cocklensis TaxID=887465 RepID=A0A9W4DG70_9ACTN|nr:hypothetical protein [Actinacidiphila cocklensis]MDD1058578.1 hypothetical protein [Actinacidiphila cocklensis]CAG6390749.1 hypothetical protein SCOCK_10217 [Actinacidiphila cocklensis]
MTGPTEYHGSVELLGGYFLIGADGNPTTLVAEADYRIEGGFVHVRIAGSGQVQVVSAPAVRRLTHAGLPG